MARRLRGENRDLVDTIAERFGREISIESVSDFHVHEVRMLRARTREEISGDSSPCFSAAVQFLS